MCVLSRPILAVAGVGTGLRKSEYKSKGAAEWLWHDEIRSLLAAGMEAGEEEGRKEGREAEQL